MAQAVDEFKLTYSKLKLVKNKRVAIPQNNNAFAFRYIFEWYNGTTKVNSEKILIPADEYLLPVEDYDMDEILEQKKGAGVTFGEGFAIEEVEV
tara:strand:+ start:1347 stop:1628 length:282 start_codon:yes stop_codon:yes gene_type:complete